MAPGARRGAPRVQQLRRPPRPPRGDDARHVRQHPAAQRAGRARRARTPRTSPTARRCSSTTPRCATQADGRAAGHPRGHRVRQRQLPRLGRQGHPAAGRARRHRPELRAHPSLQPRGHGRAAAPVPARRERRVAGPRPAARRSTSRASATRLAPAPGAAWSRPATAAGERTFRVICRLDGPIELDYYRQGGILPAVLRARSAERRRPRPALTASAASTTGARMIGGRQPLRGNKPGDRRIRVERPQRPYFRYTGKGVLTAKAGGQRADHAAGRAAGRRTRRASSAGRWPPRRRSASACPRRRRWPSSARTPSAPAPMPPRRSCVVLVAAGAAALAFSVPIAIAIAILLAVVVHQLPPDRLSPTRRAAARTPCPRRTSAGWRRSSPPARCSSTTS